MGKVIVVKCPLCSMSRRYKKDADPSEFFSGQIGDVILFEQVGGKHKRGFDDIDKGIIRQGRGSARGKIRIERSLKLEELDPELKARIKSKSREIINRI